MFNQITGDYLLVDDFKNPKKFVSLLHGTEEKNQKPVPGQEGRINRHMQIWLINRN